MSVPKLRFREFDRDWTDSKLGQLIGISSASRVFKEQWQESGVPFYRTSDVISIFKNKENEKAYISLELFEELAKKSGKIQKGDLLVTGGGTIGIPYLVPNDEPLYFKDADLLWLKSSGVIDGSFLYNFFISPKFREYLKSISHTGTISHFTIEQAKKTPFEFPSKPEQTKIASFLSAVDEKISQLSQKYELLSQYKQCMMQKLFSQQIRFKADDGSEFGEWEEKKLGEISKTFSGGTPQSSNKSLYEGDIPFIKSGEISKCKTEQFINETALKQSSAKLINKGDLLYALYGATSGQVAISQIEGAINQAVLCIRSSLNTIYLLNFFLLEKDSILSTYLQGGQGNLSASILKEILVPIPCQEEQTKIAHFLSAIDQKIEKVVQQIEETKQWKKGLLQQMFV